MQHSDWTSLRVLNRNRILRYEDILKFQRVMWKLIKKSLNALNPLMKYKSTNYAAGRDRLWIIDEHHFTTKKSVIEHQMLLQKSLFCID